MPKDKEPNSILDALEADTDLIAEELDNELGEAYEVAPPAQSPKLQAHLMRKSLIKEERQWRDILLSPETILYMRLGSKMAAQSKRTRLYHARTYLMEIYGHREEYKNMAEQLAAYSLSIMERGDSWYIAILDLGIGHEELLTPEDIKI